jgi:TetR/AcrR family transcriptional regulator, lmrAB and yxaGH operons repressor
MADASRSKLSTRARIVNAAKHLFQQRGYHAVGTAEIVAEADATKGSMYHHFPEGKEQIACEVVVAVRDDVLARLDALEQSGLQAAAIVEALAEGMARWLELSRYREGSLLASLTVGAVPESAHLQQALAEAFEVWRAHLAALLVRQGFRKQPARALAQTVLAGLEGALLVARIDGDARVVVEVGRTLASLISCDGQTRQRPGSRAP